jgi:hypothetical protein
VPLGASDVHALMSYHYAKMNKGPVKMMGHRCKDTSNSPSCKDVNAGAFHIVMTNMLALRKDGFAMDMDSAEQVWNQPVYGFSSEVLMTRQPTRGSAEGTVKEVQVKTSLKFIIEEKPSWETPKVSARSNKYIYWLELDSEDKIIGGSWEDDHPDFLWTQSKSEFSGEWAILNEMIAP